MTSHFIERFSRRANEIESGKVTPQQPPRRAPASSVSAAPPPREVIEQKELAGLRDEDCVFCGIVADEEPARTVRFCCSPRVAGGSRDLEAVGPGGSAGHSADGRYARRYTRTTYASHSSVCSHASGPCGFPLISSGTDLATDIYPIRPGHTLLIPKAHYERVWVSRLEPQNLMRALFGTDPLPPVGHISRMTFLRISAASCPGCAAL